MPSAWNQFVKKYYEEKKKTNPAYKFKQALSDAAPVWKSQNKGGVAVVAVAAASMPAKKGSRKASRKSRKATKSHKGKKGRSYGRKTRRH